VFGRLGVQLSHDHTQDGSATTAMLPQGSSFRGAQAARHRLHGRFRASQSVTGAARGHSDAMALGWSLIPLGG
jgi:hypothetical protein